MHNLYPLLYGKAVWDASVAAHGEGGAVLWARAAWAGSQRYPVHWSGDGVARWQDLPCVLRAMLSFGLSGFPFSSSDIGGFSGWPSPELYLRWAQLGLFSSHVRAHGAGQREPWVHGEQVEDAFRRFAELRYRLLPYLWTEARRCAETSLPMARAMVLDFPDDPTSEHVDDQYLLGEHLLVAPVLDAARPAARLVPARRLGRLRDRRGRDRARRTAPSTRRSTSCRCGCAPAPSCRWARCSSTRPSGRSTRSPSACYAPAAAGSYAVRTDAGEIAIRYVRTAEVLEVTVEGAPGEVLVELHGCPPLDVRLVTS